MVRRGSSFADGASQEDLDRGGRRLLLEDRNPNDAPREMVDRDRHPPTEGPNRGECEGKPRNPESEHCWHGRQVGQPNVIWTSRGHAALGGGRTCCWPVGPSLLREHPADGGRGEMKPSPAEHVCDPPGSHRGTENLETPNDS